jgi:SRSO17 transposase
MDVELQILKHLARDAQPTVSFIDEYCAGYKDLFPEVRSYECFKYLHIGISIYQDITFPLMFKVFKPQGRLNSGYNYQTKIKIASLIIPELIEFGFKIKLVLADSLYGESRSFIRTLDKATIP